MKSLSFKKTHTIIIGILLLLSILISNISFVAAQTPPGGTAGSETGLVKCGVSRDCTICDIFILIRDIFNFALGLLAALAVLSIVIGGIYVLTSAGNSGRVSEGYSIITNAVIGLLLVMASFLLFSFVLAALGFQTANFSAVLDFQEGQLFNVKCDNSSTFNDNGQNTGGGSTPGGGSGNVGSLNVACLDATNIDDNISAVMRAISFYEGAADRAGYFRLVGGKMYSESQNVHPGADDPDLYTKTGLNSDAYGRFQMLSTTWPGWAASAGVPTAKSGTYTIREGTFAYYNMSPQYQDAAVAGTLKKNRITDCQSFRTSSYRCTWASIVGCKQESDKTRTYDWAETCAKMLEDERTGACK